MDINQLKRIIEGMLLAAGQPIAVERIQQLFHIDERPVRSDIMDALTQIRQECADRGFELIEVASGYRFQIRQELSPWISRLWEEKPQKYSRALLETLALIAYQQPITRGEIEQVRGVAVSTSIIKTLLEREWVRVVGHREVPGRPAIYATTHKFLDYFNLMSLDQLPTLAEIRELSDENLRLDLENTKVNESSEELETESVSLDSSEGQKLEEREPEND
ncbi:MAG: SMC-Scp complex subunit ScpB [Pseudomonadales bacterium]|nr:SMC-Scp complex subunit ScpB [Pseudomonadales bacterium]